MVKLNYSAPTAPADSKSDLVFSASELEVLEGYDGNDSDQIALCILKQKLEDGDTNHFTLGRIPHSCVTVGSECEIEAEFSGIFFHGASGKWTGKFAGKVAISVYKRSIQRDSESCIQRIFGGVCTGAMVFNYPLRRCYCQCLASVPGQFGSFINQWLDCLSQERVTLAQKLLPRTAVRQLRAASADSPTCYFLSLIHI